MGGQVMTDGLDGELRRAVDPSLRFDIDEEISLNIGKILSDEGSLLYDRYFFKNSNALIEIFYPSLPFGGEFPFRSPDYIRHILSAYPVENSLSGIEKILFRPRYFSQYASELAALFFKKEKILVEYLHHPHLYEVSRDEFGNNQSYDIVTIEDNHRLGTGVQTGSKIKIPSILYYIHTSFRSSHNDIDKFFITANLSNDEHELKLTEISEFYKNNGY